MSIPNEIKKIMNILVSAKFEVFAVGGCIRDLMMGKKPEDWDLATDAHPEEIQALFEDNGYNCFYENDFGTVGVVLPENERRDFSNIVEITTYRTESSYSDKRHPDKIHWAKTIEEDLSRRDFTSNAIAVKIVDDKTEILDPYRGSDDISNKIIRAVGDPNERFSEDALRMFRAIRFSTTLNFSIEPKTFEAIEKNAEKTAIISKERIRDELIKMIMSRDAAKGIDLLRETGILKHVIPELEIGYGVSQNKHHIYDCYQHNLLTLDYAAKKNFNLHVRLAGLLHDIAKPHVKVGEGEDATFYNHEVVGAKMTQKILERLKFPKKEIEKIVILVRFHLFYYNVGEVSESSVRRLVRQVGIENMDDLIKLRMADRVGSGVPKAEPYKLRHLKYLIEKTSSDPISTKMLAIDGAEIMRLLKIDSGPKVGKVLSILLSEVLSNPENNDVDKLRTKVEWLGSINEKELDSLSDKAKREIDEIETKRDEMTKRKYWVT
ncbi:MAG: HD domain-containing protein [Minisyncoccales bacterium]|jgi:tRNA nucleotidyltransferase (CCA-adding enzyme)